MTVHAKIGGMLAGVVRRCSRLMLAVVVMTGMLAAVRPAVAQIGWNSQMGDMGNSITKRGLKAYGEILKLDAEQLESAMTLLEGHKTAQQAIMKKMQEKLQEIQQKAQETGDWSGFQTDWPKQAAALGKESEAVEKGFFADLKGILTAEQEDKWTKVERYRRREKGMRFGFASGAAADVSGIAMKLKAEPAGTNSAEYLALMEQYEAEIDRVMVAMEKKNEEMQSKMTEPGMMSNPAKIGEMMKEYYDVARQGRDLNRDYSRRLMPLMEEGVRAKFDREMKSRSFPRVYKESYADKLFAATDTMSDLSADQKEAVKALRATYLRERSPIDEKWAKAIEDQEEEAGGSINVMMRGFMGQNNGKDNPVKDAREERKTLDDKTIEKLKSGLSEKQRAALPEKKIEPMNPMADMMPNEEPEE
jgi:hypothetical protein